MATRKRAKRPTKPGRAFVIRFIGVDGRTYHTFAFGKNAADAARRARTSIDSPVRIVRVLSASPAPERALRFVDPQGVKDRPAPPSATAPAQPMMTEEEAFEARFGRDVARRDARSSKPLIIRKVGRGYEVWLDVDAARASVRSVKLSRLASHGDAAKVPLTRDRDTGNLTFHRDSRPERFKTKGDARHVAHKFGRYVLDLGDFASTYVEGW